jgi:predicted nicotinamide N-methyase
MNTFSTPGYKTKTESLSIEGISIELLRITNIDELYEKLVQKGPDHEEVKDERIPYWCDLWPSAIALSKHLVKTGLINENKSVLEIGCGLGLPGIIAGKLKANVTLTDYLPDAIEFAKKNWSLNNNTEAKFQLLDWRNPDPSMASDLLLASDVAYEKRSFDALINAFDVLVKPSGTILMSEPNRSYTSVFFNLLKNSGFLFSVSEFIITLNQITTKVNVFEIKKNG